MDDLSQFAGFENLVDRPEERGITEDVTDQEGSAVGFRGLDDVQRFQQGGCDWFFQEHIIACVQGGQGGSMVQLVLGGIDHRIGDFPCRKGFAPTLETTLGGDLVRLCEFCPPDGVRLGNSDKPGFVRVLQGVIAIRFGASVPGAEQEQTDGVFHGISPVCLNVTIITS